MLHAAIQYKMHSDKNIKTFQRRLFRSAYSLWLSGILSFITVRTGVYDDMYLFTNEKRIYNRSLWCKPEVPEYIYIHLLVV